MARRPPSTRLVKLLRSSAQLVFVVDEQRKITFVNDECCAWLGCAETDLVGKSCSYQSGESAHPEANALCPPPESFLGQIKHVSLTAPNGNRCSVICVPLPQSTADSTGRTSPNAVCVIGTDPTQWLVDVDSASGVPNPHEELQRLRADLGQRFQLEQLIGSNPSLQRLRQQIELASQSGSRVLICGPPGSSREQFGRVVHYHGQGPAPSTLVPLSCAILDADLIESTVSAFLSRFANLESGHTPALMLLDVDELALDAQTLLANVLEITQFDLQTISTSRQSLVQLAREGRFRADLANLLSTLVIEIPPLAERREDIPILAQVFLERQNERRAVQLSGFSEDALDSLAAYNWPYNLDELQDVVERSCKHASGPVVGIDDLPEKIHFALQAVAYPQPVPEPIELDAYLDSVEAELIRRAIEQAGGNKTRAAGLLGITRARLHRKANS